MASSKKLKSNKAHRCQGLTTMALPRSDGVENQIYNDRDLPENQLPVEMVGLAGDTA